MSQALKLTIMGEEASDLLGELHERSFEGSPEKHWTGDDFKSLFNIHGTEAYILSQGDRPVGFAFIRTILAEAELLTFCILPERRGERLSEKLLSMTLQNLKQQKTNRIFLEVRKSNIGAIKVYRKMFFMEIGVRKEYYTLKTGRKEDALIMEFKVL